MITFSIMFFVLALLVYLWPTLCIYLYLKRILERVPNYFLFNLRILHYLKKYRKHTKINKGQCGPLYFFWYFSIAISVILVTLGILLLLIG